MPRWAFEDVAHPPRCPLHLVGQVVVIQAGGAQDQAHALLLKDSSVCSTGEPSTTRCTPSV